MCALAPDTLGLRVREALAARGGLAAVAKLALPAAFPPSPEPASASAITDAAAATAAAAPDPLRCKAANALGALAVHPAVARALLQGCVEKDTIAAAAAAMPGPADAPADAWLPAATAAAVRASLGELLASADAYAQADACFALGMLARHGDAAAVAAAVAPSLPRAEALFARAALAYNRGRDKLDNLAVFALVLAETVRGRLPGALLLPPPAAVVEAAVVAASAADAADADFVRLVCSFLHAVAQQPAGRAVLREARVPARLTGVLRRHGRLRPYVQLVIAAAVARSDPGHADYPLCGDPAPPPPV